MEYEFKGKFGRENSQGKGKSFYKGRDRAIANNKNPSQWLSYNKHERVSKTIKHHDPLSKDIAKARLTGILSKKSLDKSSKDNNSNNDNNDMNQTYLDAKATKEILKISKEQLNDHNKGNIGRDTIDEDNDDINGSINNKVKLKQDNFSLKTANLSLNELLGNDIECIPNDPTNKANNSSDTIDDININKNEEKALELFMPNNANDAQSITDMILNKSKINELNNVYNNNLNANDIINTKIPKRVRILYRDIAKVLKNWRSGNMPKGFKIIPQLDCWEEILYITKPDEWTDNVTFEATKCFVSQSNNFICQRYFNTVLLTKIRQDIRLNKKLNFHLYNSVKKALFKPQAFFRGFLIPLCRDQCTGKEAIIIGSVIEKTSIPCIQSALALYKLIELEYSGPTHYFIKVLLNKKYSLPVKVITSVVEHFISFKNDERHMPVIWHQTLLIFIERYNKCLNDYQKKMKLEKHYLVMISII